MINIDNIIAEKKQLEEELRFALSTMEKKDDILIIFNKIKENQAKCPHFSSEYNWVMVDGNCPYCGKKLKAGE